jgi:hypothetical protein
MKWMILLAAIGLLNSENSCSRKTNNSQCYKGRLEIKGICANYTIKILQGPIDSSKISTSWQDENTGKSYTNVFALDSRCSFPTDMKEGDEFYFSLKDENDKDCNVCMAYYPTPPKRLAITVLKTACP